MTTPLAGSALTAAINWYNVRTTMFAKEKNDISDWKKLAEAENSLMTRVKEFVNE